MIQESCYNRDYFIPYSQKMRIFISPFQPGLNWRKKNQEKLHISFLFQFSFNNELFNHKLFVEVNYRQWRSLETRRFVQLSLPSRGTLIIALFYRFVEPFSSMRWISALNLLTPYATANIYTLQITFFRLSWKNPSSVKQSNWIFPHPLFSCSRTSSMYLFLNIS